MTVRAGLLFRLALLCFIAAHAALANAADLLIQNARLIDGTGSPARDGMSILIREGRVVGVAESIAATDAEVLDADGLTVVPGLIDSHVHLAQVPGAAFRNDSAALTRDLLLRHLRAYVACGVTTVLDAGIPPDAAAEIQALLKAGNSGPQVLFLSPMLTAPDGYAAYSAFGRSEREWATQVSDTDDVDRAFTQMDGLDPVGTKVFIEAGFARPTWPILDPELRAAIVKAARAHERPIYVHGSGEEEQSIGLDMGAHALVHTGFNDAAPSASFLQRLRGNGTYVMTTFTLFDAWLIGYHPERLDDPLIQLVVPEVEIDTARDPESLDLMFRSMLRESMPSWLPDFVLDWIAALAVTEDRIRDSLASSQRAIRDMHEAGTPIVLGTDSGNSPVIPYQFHGATTLREIELLGEAGLSPMEVLEASTRVAAEMLGLSGEIGTVEPGKRANLVVLRADPLTDASAYREIAFAIKDGIARSPEDWMRLSPAHWRPPR
jgi:imidazolonepropionase-like amidohydrolase